MRDSLRPFVMIPSTRISGVSVSYFEWSSVNLSHTPYAVIVAVIDIHVVSAHVCSLKSAGFRIQSILPVIPGHGTRKLVMTASTIEYIHGDVMPRFVPLILCPRFPGAAVRPLCA